SGVGVGTTAYRSPRALAMETRRETTDIRVAVELGPRSYEVRVVTGRLDEFGPFVRAALEATWSGRSCRSALIVTDTHLADLSLVSPYRAALSRVGIESGCEVLEPGEASKSLACASRVHDELVRPERCGL